jgi:dephospho-CoA kinase
MTDIYGVTGMPLAGKTTVADIIAGEGYTVLDMGDVVRREMEKSDIPVSKTGEFVQKQRKKHGMAAIAYLSAPYLESILEETDKVVITGMRGWDEKERFEEEVGEDLEIIGVWASRSTRQQRREERGREEDLEGQGFHERDLRELENGVGDLLALSHHLIINDSIDLDELEHRVKDVIGTATYS